MSVALELDDLACARGERLLFAGLAATVRAGELLRIAGANGSGKTSLLRLICGLGQPEHGEVRWRGRGVAAARDELHGQLIFLGHVAALKDRLSAVENLVAATGLAGALCSAEEATAALAAAGLHGVDHLPVRLLSQGQRKRVALARLALQGVASRGLWVLDEPFNALDGAATAWLLGLIATHLAAGGVVVLTSHQRVAFDARVTEVTLSL